MTKEFNMAEFINVLGIVPVLMLGLMLFYCLDLLRKNKTMKVEANKVPDLEARNDRLNDWLGKKQKMLDHMQREAEQQREAFNALAEANAKLRESEAHARREFERAARAHAEACVCLMSANATIDRATKQIKSLNRQVTANNGHLARLRRATMLY